ncbi:hypothetical protein [Caulobacter sp. NIBR1757]|uniref:hypothetical protein n=1 Tax=Caulobacter sp. NIBR1757 TaxID=3016000 RepID=UPI0022F03969|nr:hypothetical protein [Caulobacter sp. NIBR1757]
MKDGSDNPALRKASADLMIQPGEQFSFSARITGQLTVGGDSETCDGHVTYDPFKAEPWTSTGNTTGQCAKLQSDTLAAWKKHPSGEYAVAGKEEGEEFYDCVVVPGRPGATTYECRVQEPPDFPAKARKLAERSVFTLTLNNKSKEFTHASARYLPPSGPGLSKISLMTTDLELVPFKSHRLPRVRTSRTVQEGSSLGIRYRADILVTFKYKVVTME